MVIETTFSHRNLMMTKKKPKFGIRSMVEIEPLLIIFMIKTFQIMTKFVLGNGRMFFRWQPIFLGHWINGGK